MCQIDKRILQAKEGLLAAKVSLMSRGKALFVPLKWQRGGKIDANLVTLSETKEVATAGREGAGELQGGGNEKPPKFWPCRRTAIRPCASLPPPLSN